MRVIARALTALLLATGAATALAGCETTEGVGRDVQSAGQAIEDVAD